MLAFHEKVKKLFQLDTAISVLYVVLSIFGLIMIYSASSYYGLTQVGNSENFLIKQLLFVLIGMPLMLVVANLGPRIFRKERLLYIAFGIVILLLLVVFAFTDVNGARSWIRFAGIGIQPSEFAKVLLIWASAYYYSKFQDTDSMLTFFKYPLGMTIVILGLVMMQPDLGTSVIILLIVWLLTLTTGFSKKAMIGSGVILGLGYAATYLPVSVIEYIPFKPYQLARFLSFHNPWGDQSGAGYQAIQGFLALARGSWMGTGLSTSVQKTGFLPEAHTDFIMAIVGEELGFIIVWLVLVMLFALILLIFWKGQRCKSLLARYLCYGVAIFFLVQTSINIGALLGLAPITGVPLPFISYGGSSYLVSSIAIGMVLFALKENQAKEVAEQESEEQNEEIIGR